MYEEKIIVTQLNVALARFTIQYLDWRNPLVEIINTLNGLPGKLLLFLKIIPGGNIGYQIHSSIPR